MISIGQLKKIKKSLVRRVVTALQKIENINNFYLLNLNPLRYGKILFRTKPHLFQQVTLITGQGKVEIGENCIFGSKLGGFHRGGSIELQSRFTDSKIKIGNNIATNNNLFICAANYIEIGDDCLIGQYVTIMDFEAHGITPEERRILGTIGSVTIGRNVWIGNNVVILKNSVIGDNDIIAAGAVVSGQFPANVIIGGVPAKIIKEIA